jgi:hypothetical protein
VAILSTISFQDIQHGDAILEANQLIAEAIHNCLDPSKPLQPKRTVTIEIGLVPVPGQGRQYPSAYAVSDFHPVRARRAMQPVQVNLVKKEASLDTSCQASLYDEVPEPMVLNGDIPTVETLLDGQFLRLINLTIQAALEDLIDTDRPVKGTRKVKCKLTFASNDQGDTRENYECRHEITFTPSKRVLPVKTYKAKTSRQVKESDYPVTYIEAPTVKEKANA